MTDVQVRAILMGLAPNPPADYEHRARPQLAAAPDLEAHIGEHKEAAQVYEYEDGGQTVNLYDDAEGLDQWFRDEGGTGDMDAASAYEHSVKAVLQRNPRTKRADVEAVAKKMVDALERYAADYRAWKTEHDEAMRAWNEDRGYTWRRLWAENMLAAAA